MSTAPTSHTVHNTALSVPPTSLERIMTENALKVLVLAGGPDREREVSLASGKAVAEALQQAGHDVQQRDISPDDLSALDEFEQWGGQVVFPALHGVWGEGGGAQAILDQRGIAYVGCQADVAKLCMDKYFSKVKLFEGALPTLPFELVQRGEVPSIRPPLVLKARNEGSSIDLEICHTQEQATAALANLFTRHEELLAERFSGGIELTISVLHPLEGDEPYALPPICIKPTTEYYDYEAKYTRDDTQYLFDRESMGLEARELEGLGVLAVETFNDLGCRHMARVDFIVDENHRPWILEVNTIPGFTSHSLLPMAANHAGMPMPALVDHLVQLAVR